MATARGSKRNNQQNTKTTEKYRVCIMCQTWGTFVSLSETSRSLEVLVALHAPLRGVNELALLGEYNTLLCLAWSVCFRLASLLALGG